uniref:Uncharacterized protein n=1 Tax=Glossina austeni TaxID=7395 RepID=A0A1A9VST3_GLOAU
MVYTCCESPTLVSPLKNRLLMVSPKEKGQNHNPSKINSLVPPAPEIQERYNYENEDIQENKFLTFKDGQVGVNFLGYHAQAGLGGGQNQNGLLGGLHASAGTPWGQNAAAGLGGNVNGRASGLLYAGAQSSPDVGASTVLAGDTSMGGFGGSEAHANGLVAGSSRTVSFNGNPQNKAHTERRQLIADTQPNLNSINTNANAQVSANTDFNTYSNANANANADTNVKTVVRSRKVIQTQPPTTAGVNSNLGISYNAQANGEVVRSALQIPIGILQSLQQSLSGLSASKTVTVNKHISK